MMIIALVAALAAPAQFENVPLEWTCSPTLYGDGGGCDCGCGVVDPDCGDPDTFERSGCSKSACSFGSVPSANDPTRCVTNVCNDGYVGPGEACDDGGAEGNEFDGCSSDCSTVALGFRCSSQGAG